MTAQDILAAALRKIGAIDPGESISASAAADALETLQTFIDFLSSKKLMIYAQTSASHALGTAVSYTIGTGGAFNTTRPVNVVGASITVGGLDYPLTIMDPGKYRSISQKTLGGIPSSIMYVPGYPLGTIYFDSAPGTGTTLNLDSLVPLTEPATLTTTISFPPGYKHLFMHGLAIALAPEFGRQVDPVLAAIYQDALDTLLAKNASAQVETMKVQIIMPNGRYSIDGG